MVFIIYWTDTFKKSFAKLDEDIQDRFKNMFVALQEDPYAHGKPLGYPWFRELKSGKYRVYYLIHKNQIVLLMGLSEKKNQRKMISNIRMNMDQFLR